MSNVFYRSPGSAYPRISHGEGVFLFDTGGKRYLDGSSGALVANLGHGRAEIARAMEEQAAKVGFAHTARFTSDAQEELADRIAGLLPFGLRHSYFVSGGSEATETAVKLVRQFHLERGEPQRVRILARWASYHGNSLGALAASGHISRRQPYLPLLSPAFLHFDPPVEGCPGAAPGRLCPCLGSLANALERADPKSVAAIILEPVGGSADSGLVPHPGYLAGVRRLADAHGVLLISDEVMTGFGRTGEILGTVHDAVAPDLITCAKGLSGGYAPLGAVVTNDLVHSAIANGSGRFAHGFTYGGHPVACAAGSRALAILEDEGLVERSRERGHLLRRGLEEVASRHPLVSRVRGRGLMQGMVLQTAASPGARSSSLADIAFDLGLIIYSGSGGADGPLGDHVLVAPPLVIEESEIGQLLDLLDQALDELD